MNLSDFSLLKEDDLSYTVAHPSGKSFRVSKKGLNSKAQELVSKLKKEQHFDEGGETAPLPAGDPATLSAPSGDQSMAMTQPEETTQAPQENSAPLEVENIPDRQPASGVPAEAEQAANKQATPQNQQGPFSTQPMQKQLETTQNAQKTEQNAANTIIDAERQRQMKLSLEQNELELGKQEHDKKVQSIIDWAKDPKNAFNANRVWDNASTPSKITAGISMILGGIGSGLTHQPNMAAQMINDTINRDIETQKGAQENQKNLYRMEMDRYGNDLQATASAHNIANSIVLSKVQQAQASATSAESAQRLAAISADLQNKINIGNYKMSFFDMQSKPGQSFSTDPAQLVPMFASNPEEAKEALNEINKRKWVNSNYDLLMQKYDQAEKENTLLGRTGRLGFTPPAMEALENNITPLIRDKDGRPSDFLLNTAKKMFPGPLEKESTATEKRKNFSDWLKQGGTAASFSKSMGIDLDKFDSTSLKQYQSPSDSLEGKIAVNPQTGQKIIMQNGQWKKYGG
jgi:hypothetical protein